MSRHRPRSAREDCRRSERPRRGASGTSAPDLTVLVWPAGDRAAAAAAVGGATADLEPVDGWLDGAAGLVRAAAPAVLTRADGVLVVAKAGRRRSLVVAPDGRRVAVPTEAVAAWLRQPAEASYRPVVQRLATAGAATGSALPEALLAAHLAGERADGVWAVRPGPGSSTRSAVRAADLPRRVAAFVGLQVVASAAFLASWVVLGRAAFDGRLTAGSLAGWAALLAVSAATRLAGVRLEGSIGLRGGRALRQRALSGALRLEPDAVRSEGVGRLTGRVLETEVAEDLAVGGGLLALIGVAQLVAAAAVLPGAAAAGWLAALLVSATAVTALVGHGYARARGRWTDHRLALTDRFVEDVLGHRSRRAQCPPERWHDGESGLLTAYAAAAVPMDRRAAVLLAVVPRAWVLGALLALASGSGSATALAVAFGATLLGFEALQMLGLATTRLADAAVAARQVRPFLTAAGAPLPAAAGPAAPSPPVDGPVLRAAAVSFRHPGLDRAVLDGCDLSLDVGDRLVLEGASGAGKSTLAAVLAGQRRPSAGDVRLQGRTLDELGVATWRRRVALAPQLHENHLLLGSLAYNLLLGRQWPPGAGDLEEAGELCRKLGLGPLLERMPAGLAEMVGDSGWQLSQGERSLVFVARALLQRPEIVLLDESFGSLDPLTLRTAVAAVVDRAPTLLVVRQ